MMGTEVRVLVVDSGAFIKAAPLEKWSSNVVTVQEVISEIRDENTRRRLQVLPYELHLQEPTRPALQRVTQFAKKTGDYGSLSAVDMKLLALTYQLACEHEPEKILEFRERPFREEPSSERVSIPGIVGFYSKAHPGKSECKDDEEEEEEEEEDKEDEPNEDDEGWINPENFVESCVEMGGVLDEAAVGIEVGCVTTDFAMQNVLLQMGLTVISVDGLRIKQLRTYANKCKACFRTTTNTVQFCPHCGNRTLAKVSITVGEDGRVRYHFLSSKQFSRRGLRYSLPLPKGGRHANNPVLTPDQIVTYKQRRSRKGNVNALHPDYIAQSSPFALNDVSSRGAQVSFQGGRKEGKRRNPNVVKPKLKRK